MSESTDRLNEIIELFERGDQDGLAEAFDDLSDGEKFRLFGRLDRERHKDIYEALARE